MTLKATNCRSKCITHGLTGHGVNYGYYTIKPCVCPIGDFALQTMQKMRLRQIPDTTVFRMDRQELHWVEEEIYEQLRSK